MNFSEYNDKDFKDLASKVKAEELRRNRLSAVDAIRGYFNRHPEANIFTVEIHFNGSIDGMFFMPGIGFYDNDDEMLSDEEYELLDSAPKVDWLSAFDFDGESGDCSWYRFTFRCDFKDFDDYDETTSDDED